MVQFVSLDFVVMPSILQWMVDQKRFFFLKWKNLKDVGLVIFFAHSFNFSEFSCAYPSPFFFVQR